jgi:DsbC/DsbD-like thiol-disulfide interchange protein
MKLGIWRTPVVLLFLALPTIHYPLPTFAQVPSGREVVKPSAYTSVEPVPPGGTFQIAVVLKIRNGFHINSHVPSAEYLIATNLTPANPPTGFKLGEISYPKGEMHTFAFSKTPLNVYQDKVIVRFPVTVLANAPLGAQHIPLKLRYQACNQELCLPPVTLDVDAAFTVDANPANSRPAHPELFPSR